MKSPRFKSVECNCNIRYYQIQGRNGPGEQACLHATSKTQLGTGSPGASKWGRRWLSGLDRWGCLSRLLCKGEESSKVSRGLSGISDVRFPFPESTLRRRFLWPPAFSLSGLGNGRCPGWELGAFQAWSSMEFIGLHLGVNQSPWHLSTLELPRSRFRHNRASRFFFFFF